MNVVIEDESKKNKKLKIFYIGILAVCIIAIILTIVIQVAGEDEAVGTNNTLPELTDNEINQHKNEFYEIFENKVNYATNNSYKISKLEADE